jgi:outer membrane protein assembly factor BamB
MIRARLATFPAFFCVLLACGCSQFSSARAQNPGAPPLEFVGQWGAKGNGPGQLDDPQGIAVDGTGNVYIADAGSRFIHKFSPAGTPLLSFQEDSLKEPESIAVDSDGVIYVSDPSRSSVFVFLPDDEKEHHHEMRLRTKGSSENSLSLAVDIEGVTYVLDERAGKVFTFSSRFHMGRSWVPDVPSSANGKSGPASGPMQLGGDGNLYIADLPGNRLLRFSTDGRFMAAIAPSGAQGDPRIADQFTVSRSYIFIMDANGSLLHVWNMDGSPKVDVDLSAKLGQAHRLPPLLAASPRRELFVLDTIAARVLRYRLNF